MARDWKNMTYQEAVDLFEDGEAVMAGLEAFGPTKLKENQNTPVIREALWNTSHKKFEAMTDEEKESDPKSLKRVQMIDLAFKELDTLTADWDKDPDAPEVGDEVEIDDVVLETASTPAVIDTTSTTKAKVDEFRDPDNNLVLGDISDFMHQDPDNFWFHLGTLLQAMSYAEIPNLSQIPQEIQDSVSLSLKKIESAFKKATTKS